MFRNTAKKHPWIILESSWEVIHLNSLNELKQTLAREFPYLKSNIIATWSKEETLANAISNENAILMSSQKKNMDQYPK